MSDPLAPYRTDHLFLLIGANPLPNYVAARLLARGQTTIWLLHSDDYNQTEPNTKPAAERLKHALSSLRREGRLSFRDAHLVPLPSADDQVINRAVRELLRDEKIEGTVGLHYTGGTKPMAVHVYRALEQAWAKKSPPPTFSYLDPRKLALRVDGYGTRSSALIPILADAGLRGKVDMKLDGLAGLHGYERSSTAKTQEWGSTDDIPELLALIEKIVQVHRDAQGFREWREWISQSKCEAFPDPSLYPSLADARLAMDAVVSGDNPDPATIFARKLRPHDPGATLKSCTKWFLGSWLEEWVPTAFSQSARDLGMSDTGQNLKYVRSRLGLDDFDLDAAALLGYQLFAISCIATEKKEKAKEHLFECYVRARQLGGDEARAAVVCLVESGDSLRQELERAWDAEGKIRVFDRNDLKDLPAAFERWFRTASS